MKKTKTHKIRNTILIIIISIFIVGALLISRISIKPPQTWGITFSYTYMESFGLDWHDAYRAMLDDLGAKYIRLPVYWSKVSVDKNKFDFTAYDFQMKEAETRGAHIILAIGRKTPRWPECNEPDWAQKYSNSEKQEFILAYLKEVVEKYKASPALSAWQVENEPFLKFGVCPPLDVNFLDKEIALVRSLDPTRSIIVTDSGELSLWVHAAKRADIFGTTMYRFIYKSSIGYYTYPLPPSFFRLKRALTELFVGKRPSLVIELQGEPWGPKIVYEMNKSEQYQSFNPERFKDTIKYAERTGFDVFYWWGVEWWYWLKVHEHDSTMWDIGKTLFR